MPLIINLPISFGFLSGTAKGWRCSERGDKFAGLNLLLGLENDIVEKKSISANIKRTVNKVNFMQVLPSFACKFALSNVCHIFCISKKVCMTFNHEAGLESVVNITFH